MMHPSLLNVLLIVLYTCKVSANEPISVILDMHDEERFLLTYMRRVETRYGPEFHVTSIGEKYGPIFLYMIET
jgi:hypothetical protein